MTKKDFLSNAGFGLLGVFGSTFRNTCTAQDDDVYCTMSKIFGVVGSFLGLMMMFLVIYMVGRALIRK